MKNFILPLFLLALALSAHAQSPTPQPLPDKPFLHNEWNNGWDIAFYAQVSAYGSRDNEERYARTPVRLGFNLFASGASMPGSGLDLSLGYSNRFWSKRNGHGLTAQAMTRAWLFKNWVNVGFGLELINLNINRLDPEDGRTWESLIQYTGEVKITQYNFSIDLRWYFDAAEETAGGEVGISYRLPLKGWNTK